MTKVVVFGWVCLLIDLSIYSQQLSIDSIPEPFKNDLILTYYVEPGSYGTKRETNPPAYVREIVSKRGKVVGDSNWLDIGLDYRSRFEFRDNDLRRAELTTDRPLLLRSRAYFGVKNIFDPFRVAIEFEDADRINGKFEPDNRDINQSELIQAYVELFFDKFLERDDLGNARPIYVRFGRQTFEFNDRRLIGLNAWRNTTNNFLGFRATTGQDSNDWQLDLLALKPIDRVIHQPDQVSDNLDFWAVLGHWRRWSHALTIEPYYLGLKQRPTTGNDFRERLIHSPGIRFYGWSNARRFNYDLTYTQQFGNDHGLRQRSRAITAEIGYIIQEENAKPRFSLFCGYVSGDQDPNDGLNNRFERFFGFARPWSADDYVIPENIFTPKLKVELEPIFGLKIDGGYSFFWLASATDRFNNLMDGANNRDQTGSSGSFIGHGLDLRARFKPAAFLEANIGYSHFNTGKFVLKRQEAALGKTANNSDFFYVELAFNALDLLQEFNKLKINKQ